MKQSTILTKYCSGRGVKRGYTWWNKEKISEEHESEIILIHPGNDIKQESKESDQETILVIEELDQKLSQEDEKSDQIPKRESEKLSEINGSNSLKNESEIRVKQPISNRWNKNRKNRKNRRE